MIIRFVVTNNRFLVVSYVRKNIITAILDVLNVHYYQISWILAVVLWCNAVLWYA